VQWDNLKLRIGEISEKLINKLEGNKFTKQKKNNFFCKLFETVNLTLNFIILLWLWFINMVNIKHNENFKE
jgi:hypothetical protein